MRRTVTFTTDDCTADHVAPSELTFDDCEEWSAHRVTITHDNSGIDWAAGEEAALRTRLLLLLPRSLTHLFCFCCFCVVLQVPRKKTAGMCRVGAAVCLFVCVCVVGRASRQYNAVTVAGAIVATVALCLRIALCVTIGQPPVIDHFDTDGLRLACSHTHSASLCLNLSVTGTVTTGKQDSGAFT